MKKQLMILATCVAVVSCNEPAASTSTAANSAPASSVVITSTNTASTPSTANSTTTTLPSTSTSTAAVSQPAAVTAKLEYENSANADDPKSTVYVNVNGKKTEVAKMAGHASQITKAEYKQKEIPTDAIDACGGWWAGGGDYFYIIKKGDKVELYKGWQDEGQKGKGYNWKKEKEF